MVSSQPGIALPDFLSTPRPNGSRALERTVGEVEPRLEGLRAPDQSHEFTLRPYSMELLGLWFIIGGILLPLAALFRWGCVGLALAKTAIEGIAAVGGLVVALTKAAELVEKLF